MRFFSIAMAWMILFGTAAAAASPQSSLSVGRLQCEAVDAPLAVDSSHPRLGWKLTSGVRGGRQTAYQILVASSMDALDRGTGDLWDSGRVESAATFQIAYGGKPLVSGQVLSLENPGLGRRGKRNRLEPAGRVVDGAADARRLAGRVDRKPGPIAVVSTRVRRDQTGPAGGDLYLRAGAIRTAPQRRKGRHRHPAAGVDRLSQKRVCTSRTT